MPDIDVLEAKVLQLHRRQLEDELGLPGLVGPPGRGVGSTRVGAQVAGAGLVFGSELEGDDPLGEPRELGPHPGQVSVADRPESRVP